MSPRPPYAGSGSPWQDWQDWQSRQGGPGGSTWPDRPELRIGDAERERAASQLAEHYAVGRLTQEEHAERLDRIWAARTRSELDPVFADLPGAAPASGPRPAPIGPGRTRNRPPLPLVLLLVALVAVTVVTHLPLILIGLAVWFLLVRGGCGSRSGWGHPRRW